MKTLTESIIERVEKSIQQSSEAYHEQQLAHGLRCQNERLYRTKHPLAPSLATKFNSRVRWTPGERNKFHAADANARVADAFEATQLEAKKWDGKNVKPSPQAKVAEFFQALRDRRLHKLQVNLT